MTKSLRSRAAFVSVAAGLALASLACAADPVATYTFDGTLAAAEAGVPPLTPTDPSGTSAFELATVFGRMQQVYHVRGTDSPPTSQGGLTLQTAGLLVPNSYSVELVIAFFQRQGQWRRILDVNDRQTDNGFYVNPGNVLYVYPQQGGASGFANNQFHHVVLTVGGGTVHAYLDGSQQISLASGIMDINNAYNPNSLVHIFLDNVAGPAQTEWSNASIALARFYNGALTDGEVATLYSRTTCATDYNLDTVLNPDDLGDFITDYFTSPPIPGPGGYAVACPGNPAPYDAGYKAAYTPDGSGQCNPPFPDNLGDFITAYFDGC